MTGRPSGPHKVHSASDRRDERAAESALAAGERRVPERFERAVISASRAGKRWPYVSYVTVIIEGTMRLITAWGSAVDAMQNAEYVHSCQGERREADQFYRWAIELREVDGVWR